MKNNEVRIRIWKSGYFIGQQQFVHTTIPRLFFSSFVGIIDADSMNVGHVSVETSKGYLSVWPNKQVSSLKDVVEADAIVSPSIDIKMERREPDIDKLITIETDEMQEINRAISKVKFDIKQGTSEYQLKHVNFLDLPISQGGNCCTYAWNAFPKRQIPFFRKALHSTFIRIPNSFSKTLRFIPKV